MKKRVTILGLDLSKKRLEGLVKKTLEINPLREMIDVVSLRILGETERDLTDIDVHILIGEEYIHGRCFLNPNPKWIQSPPLPVILAHELGHVFGLSHAEYKECSYCNGITPSCNKADVMCYNSSIPFNNTGLSFRFSNKDVQHLTR